ncbi:DNA mismatch repair endonuclease MutL [Paenibacillus urinalis]|uniref:DNA mismatch repair protein MutL n=1 Tax=Paenibacillus urinalis TaxID=521520 RepID=A0AAX3MWD5_9BACL|nr:MULTISPECIES: DNA mismatch repair endonuclease MutL [Paenibacillus]WDH81139.1 DNA mismatch repair endonuclease MutL [Paenibacillus urinalis]WDH97192.1 DNA mismatch repair endonuclease MutL [Paenibacillus urinalis]WDI00854.1 DNA mismatch repair endonuclease MutL [Paenibacillus urinalis]GAK39541.1 DNA mismatch repair protein mutL [Paenibacillus sp. TCA20]
MARIHVLDEHIANQIAAGEVVERPASVVKELVENSIDAGSTRIDVSIHEGGLQSIRITDNGGGIDAEDMETAFYRHATSKIANGRELFEITSLGFRGEALPSIAAVSKVRLISATESDGRGREIVIEGGKLIKHDDITASRGTDFLVEELFYNTPARLKYMKTIQTELGHISDVLYRMALSHADIAFTLRHNGNLLLQTLGNGDLLQVIAAIYGTSAAKAMLPISGDNLDYRISGYVSRPDLTRANRNGISTIINGRYIKNYGLNQALLKAYHTLLPVNRFPLAVLQLDMHPSLVDVNVHPAKLEVRFSKEPELYAFVEEYTRAALRQEVLIPQVIKQSIGKPESKSFIQEQFHFTKSKPKEEQANASSLDRSGTSSLSRTEKKIYNPSDQQGVSRPIYGREMSQSLPRPSEAEDRERSSTANTESAAGGSNAAPIEDIDDNFNRLDSSNYHNTDKQNDHHTQDSQSYVPNVKDKQHVIREAKLNRANGDYYRDSAALKSKNAQGMSRNHYAQLAGIKAELPQFPELELIGQHHGTYLIAQNENGLYLIDQHAAHERINYEFYYNQFGNPVEASQELLLPITLEFTPSEAEQLKDKLHWFEQAGVYLEHFGGQTFRVTSYPYWLPKGDEESIILEMAEWVLSERGIDLSKLREAASIMCSCKASIKANQKLTDQEAAVLLERLADCKQPYTCPHGRPIVVSFSTYDLEKMFKRVM